MTPTEWWATLTGLENFYCHDPVKVKTLTKQLYSEPQNKTKTKAKTDSTLKC